MKYNIRNVLQQCGKPLLRVCLLLLVLFLTLVCLAAALDPYDNRIVENVRVGGLDVGGMTPAQAYRALREASNAVLENTVLTVELPEETLYLSPSDTGVCLKIWPAVRAAYRYGRTGTEKERQHALKTGYDFSLYPYLKLEKSYIREVLQNYAVQYDTGCTSPSYRLEGDAPDLEIENQTEATVCQTLVVTMGIPTAQLDLDVAYWQILSVYSRAFSAAEENYTAVVPAADILAEPEKPDLEAIYQELYRAPVDDTLDMEAYEVVPGAYGYHFNLEEAQKSVDAAEYGEAIRIPMEFIEPEIFGNDVYFRDVLGYCETPHTDDANRNHNLTLACEAMDGLVLQPGEVFSYNDTLGPRTKENGYLRAGAYSGWELVQAYGGGICQGSTTIYCAALYADLEIVQRRNHGYKVGYIDPGLDATVNWGGPDFQFRNSSHFPIKIAAEVSDGFVKVTILGTEERDYYVEMETEIQWGNSAIYAKSYKCKYDRQTGELLSRELEARSNYAV